MDDDTNNPEPVAGTLSDKQVRALEGLLAGWSQARVASSLGISPRTIRTWLKEPAFRKRLRQCRRQLAESAMTDLQTATRKAVQTLVRNLKCKRPAAEVRAAVAILNVAFADLGANAAFDRLEAIEEELEAREKDRYHADRRSCTDG